MKNGKNNIPKKVDKAKWEDVAKSLEVRRKKRFEASRLEEKECLKNKKLYAYYKDIQIIKIGNSVLDIGCGNQSLLDHLPDGIIYQGLDPFPFGPKADNVIKSTIEDCDLLDRSFDTLILFASLDHCYDVEKVLQQMNRIAKTNIAIRTNIDKYPSKSHTVGCTRKDLVKGLPDFFLKLETKIDKSNWLFDFWRKIE